MTSKLEKYLSTALYTTFGQYSIRQNYRPDWLEGLELDFYIDEIKLAAEVQGEQHYRFIEHFHKDHKGFMAQRERDEKKEYLCRLHKVQLFEVHTEKDADLFVLKVKEVTIANTPKYFYQDESPCDPRARKNGGKEKWHEIENRKKSGNTRKQIKKANVNSEERMARRLRSCEKSLQMYESGELDATPGKVNLWKMVIENKGKEIHL
jgi:hypothetical protein